MAMHIWLHPGRHCWRRHVGARLSRPRRWQCHTGDLLRSIAIIAGEATSPLRLMISMSFRVTRLCIVIIAGEATSPLRSMIAMQNKGAGDFRVTRGFIDARIALQ